MNTLSRRGVQKRCKIFMYLLHVHDYVFPIHLSILIVHILGSFLFFCFVFCPGENIPTHFFNFLAYSVNDMNLKTNYTKYLGNRVRINRMKANDSSELFQDTVI